MYCLFHKSFTKLFRVLLHRIDLGFEDGFAATIKDMKAPGQRGGAFQGPIFSFGIKPSHRMRLLVNKKLLLGSPPSVSTIEKLAFNTSVSLSEFPSHQYCQRVYISKAANRHPAAFIQTLFTESSTMKSLAFLLTLSTVVAIPSQGGLPDPGPPYRTPGIDTNILQSYHLGQRPVPENLKSKLDHVFPPAPPPKEFNWKYITQHYVRKEALTQEP